MSKKRQWNAESRKRLSQRMKGKPPANIINGVRKPKPPQVPHNKKYVHNDRRVVRCFNWLQRRCAIANRICDFPRTAEGFLLFAAEMGPIPESIKRPSVGRKDHDLGYIIGNIKWEEYSYNVWKQRRPERQDNVDEEIPF